MKKHKIKLTILIGQILAALFLPAVISAYTIQDLPAMETKNDFVLGPGKAELLLNPGESAERELYITNRLGREMTFKVEIEDFAGSRDASETIVLLGNKKGPYSLKDYIKPEAAEFTLKNKQRIILPVTIAIAKDAEPGGLYGAIFVSTIPSANEKDTELNASTGGAVTITRLGTLMFVRIKGDVKEEGFLKSFSAKGKKIFESGPIYFDLVFENNGNVHLNPYGALEIKNLFGSKVGEIIVDPWFAMPDSLRLREVNWNKSFLLGRYTAEAKINRGYGDIIDEETISFWVMPWKIILAGFAVLVLIVLFFKWVFSRFEIKRKE